MGGAGRRMGKKQGLPEPLSENHFAKVRRSAGLPPSEPTTEPSKNKKRKADTKTNGSVAKKAKTTAPVKTATTKAAPKSNGKVNGKVPNGKALKGKTKVKVSLADAEGVDGMPSDEDGDAVEALSDLEGDDVVPNDDDFAESGSEVYDSDTEQGPQRMWSDDESGAEDDLEAANVEGLGQGMDEDTEEDDDDDDDDEAGPPSAGLQTNIENERPQVLDDDDELSDKPKSFLAPDLQVIRQRMAETIRVLDDFARLAQTGRSRSEYTAQLLRDICSYYGYSEFLGEKLLGLFNPREAFAFFEANETPRPVVIRTNSLRTNRRDLAQALINRGVTLEPVGKWSKVGLQIFESSVPLGATPEYLAGHYILQAASSFLPCMALDPQENDRVLDMSSAPGGKASYLSALMKNTGLVVANDANKARCKALVGNLHRLGCRNTIVTNLDAREFPKPMGGFDRVLLDAPCTGSGVVSKDASVKTNRGPEDLQRLPHLQKQLILCAIDSLNVGGYLCYSTCSVLIEENEGVVQYALRKRGVKLVDTDLTFGVPGFASHMGKTFDPSMTLTRRYYPHTYNMDGFFVAKLQKVSNVVRASTRKESSGETSGIDKMPIVDDEKEAEKGDDFGGFDEEEDAEYIEKARKNAMRRRGLNPKAKPGKEKGAKKEKAEEKKEKKVEGQ